MSSKLTKILIEETSDGRWKLTRSRREGGETFIVGDLIEAFTVVRAAYWPDGSKRPWPLEGSGVKGWEPKIGFADEEGT